MNDTLLYRRFMVMAALMAAMGAFTAHVILETRAPATGLSRPFPAPAKVCGGERMCLVGRIYKPLA
jgi:hypothetical protein